MTEDTSTAPAGPALHAAVTAAGGARPDRAAVPGPVPVVDAQLGPDHHEAP